MIKKILLLTAILIVISISFAVIFIHTETFSRQVKKDIEKTVSQASKSSFTIGQFSLDPLKGTFELKQIELENRVTIQQLSGEVVLTHLFMKKLTLKSLYIKGVHFIADLNHTQKTTGKEPFSLDTLFRKVTVHTLKLEQLTVAIPENDTDPETIIPLKSLVLQSDYDTAAQSYSGSLTVDKEPVNIKSFSLPMTVSLPFTFSRQGLSIADGMLKSPLSEIHVQGVIGPEQSDLTSDGTLQLAEFSDESSVKDTSLNFNLSGDLTKQAGNITLTHPEFTLTAETTIIPEAREVQIVNAKSDYSDHAVTGKATVKLTAPVSAIVTADVSGPLFSDFHVSGSITHDETLVYALNINGVDCGDGECRVNIENDRTPVINNLYLNLPFLKTAIDKNSGSLTVITDNIELTAQGDFFKSSLFNGTIHSEKLTINETTYPQFTGEFTIEDKDHITAHFIEIRDGLSGTGTGTGSFENNVLDIDMQLTDYDLHKALFSVGDIDDLDIHTRATGHVTVKGDLDNVTVAGSANFNTPELFGLRFEKGECNFSYENNNLVFYSLNLIDEGPGLSGKGSINFDSEIMDIVLSGSNRKLAYLPLDFLSLREPRGQITVGGTLENVRVDADIHTGDILLDTISLGSADLSFKMDNNTITINSNTSKHIHFSGDISPDNVLDMTLSADRSQIDIDANLKLNTSFNLTASTPLEDTHSMTGTGECTVLEAFIPSEELTVKATPFPLTLNGMVLAISSVSADCNQCPIELSDIQCNLDTLAIKSDIIGEGHLPLLDTYVEKLASIKSSGIYTLSGELGGTLNQPLYHGNLNIKDGKAIVPDLTYPITEINGNIQFDPSFIKPDTITAKYGKGTIELSGIVTSESIDLRASVSDIPFDLSGIYADISGIVKLNRSGEDNLVLGGDIEAVNGFLNLNQMLTFVDTSQTAEGPQLDFNLIVRTKNFEYRDETAQIYFAPSTLMLEGNLDNPILIGTQFIDKGGTLYLSDIPMTITGGTVRFDNYLEINPLIDIQASTTVKGYNIFCSIKGSANGYPSLNLKSQPPLQKKELFALLFGSGGFNTGDEYYMSEEGFDTDAGSDLSGAGVALALNNLFAPFQSKVKKRLGIEKFQITPQVFSVKGDSSPIITLEKQISSRLTGTYSQAVSGSGDSLVQFRYKTSLNNYWVVRKEIDGSVTVELEFVK